MFKCDIVAFIGQKYDFLVPLDTNKYILTKWKFVGTVCYKHVLYCIFWQDWILYIRLSKSYSVAQPKLLLETVARTKWH